MKRTGLIAFLLLSSIVIQLAANLDLAQAKAMKLTYWAMDAPSSYRVKEIYNVLAQRVKEATNGEVILNVQAMSPITNPKNAHDDVAVGIVDIAVCITGVSPGRYPLLDSINLPGLGFTNSEMASLAVVNLVEKFPLIEQRLGDVKLLEVCATGLDMIGTSKVAVRTLEDLKGLKLRSVGDYPSRLLKTLGAVPVPMSAGNIYPSMQKGVVDGFNMAWGGITIFKLNEVSKYGTDVGSWAGSFFSLMNRKKWERLSPKNQQIFTDLTGKEWSRYMGQVTDKDRDYAMEVARKSGMEIILPSSDFKETIKGHCKALHTDYVEDLKKKGLPGQEVLDEIERFVANYK